MSKELARKAAGAPLQDQSRQSRAYFEYDIPAELYGDAKTEHFGELRVIGLKQLTPLEEKSGVARAKQDALRLAYELAEVSVAFVINANKDEIFVHAHDGSRDMLAAEMDPKIRALVMQAYSELAAPTESATTAFLKSRRIRA